MIKKFNSEEKLPAIVFVFSKRILNSLAEKAAENLNLVSAQEKKKIQTFFERSVRRLKKHDKQILQLLSLKNMLMKGIGVHHGDLLWISKEIVELLFQKNLVKLLFATESFAMGINVPSKSVIFYTIRKNDGASFRYLKSGEYTQMCGRAGRRGIDSEGNVFIFFGDDREIPELSTIKPVLQNKGEVLESKFRLTYSTIINSFTLNNFKIKDLMKKSFTENKSYLKILNLKNRNDAIVHEQSQTEIECIFSEKKPLDLNEDSFIIKYERVKNEIKSFAEDFAKNTDYKKIAKKIELPCFAEVLDNNDNFGIVVLTALKSEINGAIFECFFSQNSFEKDEIALNRDKIKKIKYEDNENDQIKIIFCEVTFQKLIQIYQSQFKFLNQNFAFLEVSRELNHLNECRDKEALPSKEFLSHKLTHYFQKLKDLAVTLKAIKCYRCEKLELHSSLIHKKRKLELEVEDNAQQMKKLEVSFGIDKFQKLIKILEELDFLDKNKLPNLNMKFAKSLSSGPEVILMTFLFNNNLLFSLSPSEIPILLSILCMGGRKAPDFNDFEEKINNYPFSENLLSSIYSIIDCYSLVKEKENNHQIVFDDFINFDMLLVLYEWCNGAEFRALHLFTDRMEGFIVRTIQKIEKYIDGLKYLYLELKNYEIVFKLEESIKILRRDIMNVQSLYLT